MSFAYIQRGLFYLTGAFATAPIVAIFFGNQPVSVFNVLFLISIFALCLQASVSRSGFSYNWTAIILLFWFAWGLVASFFGLNYFSDEKDWAANIISYIPKIMLFALLLISCLKIEHPHLVVSPFLKGLLAGFVANLVWATLEGLSFYIFGFVLNDWVFVAYANTLPSDRPTMTVVADGIIRAAGFNTDPAHLGGIIPVVVVYSMLRRSYSLLLLSLVALVFSGSTTALVCSILAVVASFGKLDVFNATKRRFSNRSAVGYLGGIVVLVVVASFGDLVYDAVSRNAQGFFDRIAGVYVSSGDEGPRYIYHAYLTEAIDFNGIWTLTGSGFGTGAYPFLANPAIPKYENMDYFPYDPESTYISYLFDVGVLGLFCYGFVLLSLFFRYRTRLGRDCDQMLVYSVLCGMIFSGLFYHYILTAYQIIVLVFAVVMSAKRAW